MNDTPDTPPSCVHTRIDHDIAIITIDNGPVNGLSDVVLTALVRAITDSSADESVRAVLLTGAGRGFSGGADLRQFGTPAAAAEPTLPQVVQSIRQAGKPTIAALHGFALGGGLELALACHWRIAQSGTQFGLPEVNVGLIPGSGGTQRLPRLIGAAEALRLIQEGGRIAADEAAALGLVDASVPGDVVSAAVTLLDEKLQSGSVLPTLDDRQVGGADGVDFDAARSGVRRSTRNRAAQLAAIDAVEAAARLPIVAGLLYERHLFEELREGADSAALRHVFLAEKTAATLIDPPSDTTLCRVARVGVIGAGTMGRGIAIAFANGGLDVTVVEQDAGALSRALDAVRTTYASAVTKGRMTEAEARERQKRIRSTGNYEDLRDSDLVVEAVFEDMDVKKSVFARLDSVCRPDTILATNTSRLDIDELAASTADPTRVLGLHFFSPANVMKLVEVVRGARTSSDVVASGLQITRSIDKLPVVSLVCEGFIGNRMLTPYRREADFLLEEGAAPTQVDSSLQGFGFAMGPHATSDLAGLDIAWAARKRAAPTRPLNLRYSRVPDALCEAGRFGQKTSAGYYRYEPGSRKPLPDPVVDTVIRQCAEAAGITRRNITDEEIVQRCLLALINEGARLLGEGIAQRASDIDVVWVDGYGFPAYRGGPMYWAEKLGLDVVLNKIQELERTHGEHWSPAPLLVERVAEGRSAL